MAYANTPQDMIVEKIIKIISRLVVGDISPYPTVHIVMREKYRLIKEGISLK